MIHPAMAALEYHLVCYRRSWRGTIFTFFVVPVVFLLGMGWSIGGYLDGDAAGQGGLGVSYLTFLAPGLLASTAMQVGVGEGTHPVYGAFHWTRTYHMMRMSPLTTTDILVGHLGYILVRVTISATGFLLVMALLGIVDGAAGLAALPAAVLVGCSMSAFVFAFSATITEPVLLDVVYRILVVPMSLFAGVFFPVAQMPAGARLAAGLLPLWHGVELCRSATMGIPSQLGAPVHAGYLLLWTVVGFLVARWAFGRRLAG
ncbi:MAG: ABC transporter permease [Micromonosporaceae bacterium]|nr:ABC transporter permease [Micromonosporaceae bacterium]